MKNIFKWICILITLLIFLYAFSASYTSENIDDLDYVIAIGIDIEENNNNLNFSFEFANINSFSENSSSEDSEPIINTVNSPSFSNAITLMDSYLGKRLNLSHCKVIVISEEKAKKGISDEIASLMNNTQIRPTTNIIISTEKASEYIKNSTSNLEQILTKYYDIFPTSTEYTGYTSNIVLGEFYDNIINSNSGAVSILGKKTTSTKNEEALKDVVSGEAIINGDRGTENIGLAVFNNSIYVGELNALDTLCYSILRNEVENFLISIDNPLKENNKLDISMEELSTTNISVKCKQTPQINIKINITGKILSNLNNIDLTNSQNLNQINDSVKSYLEEIFYTYLNKTKEYKTDINNFFKIAQKNFLNLTNFENYNWNEKYQEANFYIEINSNIISSQLIQNN